MSIAAEVKFVSNFDSIITGLDQKSQKGLTAAANLLADRIKKSLKVSNDLGLSPSPVGSPPGRGIGDIVKGIDVKAPSEDIRHVRSTAIQSRLQEFGGLVTAKNKKYLTIPLSDKAKQHKARGGNSWAFGATVSGGKMFKMRSQYGTLLLVERKGRLLIPHYVLRESVYIPARPFMRPAAHDPVFRKMAVAGFRGQVSDSRVMVDAGVDASFGGTP